MKRIGINPKEPKNMAQVHVLPTLVTYNIDVLSFGH